MAVDQRHRSDSRRLAHETKYVKAAAFIGSFDPRQLDSPFHLATDLIQKRLDSTGRHPRFGTQAQAQICPLITVSEPRFAGAACQQGNDDGGKQRDEILLEQRPAHTSARRQGAVVLHSIARSAHTTVASRIVRLMARIVIRFPVVRNCVGSSSRKSLASCDRADSLGLPSKCRPGRFDLRQR
jgi:hypothetical protein